MRSRSMARPPELIREVALTSSSPIAVPLRRARGPRHDAVDSATATAVPEGTGDRGGSGRPAPAVAVAGLQVRWAQGRPVVVLASDVDLACASQIASVGLFLRRWSHPACVDAAGVGFMDVAGLRAVLGLAGASGTVEVRRPSWAVLHLLQVLDAAGVGVQLSRALGSHPAVVLHEPPVQG